MKQENLPAALPVIDGVNVAVTAGEVAHTAIDEHVEGRWTATCDGLAKECGLR